MNEVKIDGIITQWTGFYFDNIGSGHQACVEVFRPILDGSVDHLLFLVDYDPFVSHAQPGDTVTVYGELRVLNLGGHHEAVVVADSFQLFPAGSEHALR